MGVRRTGWRRSASLSLGRCESGWAHVLEASRHMQSEELRSRRVRAVRRERECLGVDGHLVRSLPVSSRDRPRQGLPRRQLQSAFREVDARATPESRRAYAPRFASRLPLRARRGRSRVSLRSRRFRRVPPWRARQALRGRGELEWSAVCGTGRPPLPPRAGRESWPWLRSGGRPRRRPPRRGSGSAAGKPIAVAERRRRLREEPSRPPARLSVRGRHSRCTDAGSPEERMQESRRGRGLELRVLSVMAGYLPPCCAGER